MSSVTFALIKPDAFSHPFVCWSVVTTILGSGLSVLAAKVCRVRRSRAEEFYNVHRDKFFYGRLVGHMTSGPVLAMLLSGNDAINRWRQLLGPTKVFKTVFEQPNTLRAKYGLTDTRNVGHGSDSSSNAVTEADFFFPEYCDTTAMKFRDIAPSETLSRRHLFQLIFDDSISYMENDPLSELS